MSYSVFLTDDAAADLEELNVYVMLIADGRRDMQALLQRRLLNA